MARKNEKKSVRTTDALKTLSDDNLGTVVGGGTSKSPAGGAKHNAYLTYTMSEAFVLATACRAVSQRSPTLRSP